MLMDSCGEVNRVTVKTGKSPCSFYISLKDGESHKYLKKDTN